MPRPYSTTSYRQLVTSARDLGYEFLSFRTPPQPAARQLYLRHDVDYSLPLAAELAELNRSLGVKGTFFVLLRSGMYNLFSASSRESLRRIRDAEQWLGVHVSLDLPAGSADGELADRIAADVDLVRHHFDGVDPVFSWHNPSPEIIARGLTLPTPGLINAYSRGYFNDIRYVSDSVMRRTPDEIEQALREPTTSLQLLLHPLYWVIGGSDPVEVLARCWHHIIREREGDMQPNSAWAAANPAGIPEQALAAFTASLLPSTSVPRE